MTFPNSLLTFIKSIFFWFFTVFLGDLEDKGSFEIRKLFSDSFKKASQRSIKSSERKLPAFKSRIYLEGLGTIYPHPPLKLQSESEAPNY